MEALAQEAARLVMALPPDKAVALLEYARYLTEKSDTSDTEEWHRRLTDPRYAPKMKALFSDVEQEIASGMGEPMDPGRL